MPNRQLVRIVEARENSSQGSEASELAVADQPPGRELRAGALNHKSLLSGWVFKQLFRKTKSNGIDIERAFKEIALFWIVCAMTFVGSAWCLQLVQGCDKKGNLSHNEIFEAEDQPTLEAALASLQGMTDKQKNPHPKGSLAFAAWVYARLGGWTGYYCKPGLIVIL